MFKRVRHIRIDGSSLWFELPNANNDQMRKLFGTGFTNQDNQKYSDSIIVQSEMTGLFYTLYKHCARWRVGHWNEGSAMQTQFDKNQFLKMFA